MGGSGGITYSEFIVATLDIPKLLTSQKLVKLFNLIDIDGDNYLTVKDLWNFSGKKLEPERCKMILEEALDLLQVNYKP